MKRLLNIAIQNDTVFLRNQSVMDYSLFVIINHERHTVRLGIIDYIQKFNLEKTIESTVKQVLGGDEPTIISPDAYQTRFRTAMDKYFIALIPDQKADLRSTLEFHFNADEIQWCTKDTEKLME
jgi:1-phosphatidylinositol-3-phosphate 5-kinase